MSGKADVPGSSVNAAPESSIGYRPSLDGIRAVAVVAILLYHGGVAVLGGGFLGVDIFFVLSGFLITSILLSEWQHSSGIDLKRFWARRARRLLPALVLVVAAILIASAIAAGRAGESMRADSLATMFYASNWWFIAEGTSYFDQFSDPSPLRHTWSLAIEEQWYLLFPFIFLGVFALFKGRRWLGGILLCGAVASAVAMAVIATDAAGQTRAYYGTDTRMQALLVGAGMAALLTPGVLRRLAPYTRSFGVLAAIGITALLFLVDDGQAWIYQGGFLLLALLVAAVLVDVTARPTGLLANALSWGPLVWLGRISYGVYLWHWPIYLFLSPKLLGFSGLPLLTVRVAVTLLVATASYYLIELPIRQGALTRMTPATRTSLLIATPVTLVVLFVGAFVAAKPPAADSLEVIAAKAVQAPTQQPSAVSTAPGSPTRAVLLGDSNALSLFATYPPGSTPQLSVAPGTEFGCGVAPYDAMINGQQMRVQEKCWEWVRVNRLRQIQDAHANLGVLFAGSWEQYDRSIDGKQVDYTDPRWQAETEQAYADLIGLLHEQIGKVAVVTNACAQAEVDDVPVAAQFESGRFPAVVNDARRTDAVNRAIRAAAAEMSYHVPVIDLHGRVCPNRFQAQTDGIEMRTDGLHYSTAGGEWVWRWLGPQLVKARASAS